ncbi:FtsX-like permease family protein [bacterium]|nr:FtsX-like permease family protein [bacterium]
MAKKICGLKGVTEVDYGERIVKIFGEAIQIVKIIFTAIGLVLMVGILVIIFSTIRLTLLSRRHEIEIMKLVGATNWFIRWPLLIEGMLKILLGQGLAFLFLFLLYKFIDFKLVTTFAFFSFSFVFLPPIFIAGLTLFSLFLGFTGSLISCYHFSTQSEE